MVAYYLHDLQPALSALYRQYRYSLVWTRLCAGFLPLLFGDAFLSVRGLSVLKPEQVGDFITSVALFGVVLGGRLGYMLLYDFQHFIHEPWTFFKINNGGMASRRRCGRRCLRLPLVCAKAQGFVDGARRCTRLWRSSRAVSWAHCELH